LIFGRLDNLLDNSDIAPVGQFILEKLDMDIEMPILTFENKNRIDGYGQILRWFLQIFQQNLLISLNFFWRSD